MSEWLHGLSWLVASHPIHPPGSVPVIVQATNLQCITYAQNYYFLLHMVRFKRKEPMLYIATGIATVYCIATVAVKTITSSSVEYRQHSAPTQHITIMRLDGIWRNCNATEELIPSGVFA